MRCGREEHGFLAVDFLQFEVSGEKVSVGDLALLEQFLNCELRCRIVPRGQLRLVIDFYDEPIRLRHPLNLRGSFLFIRTDVYSYLVGAAFNLPENLGRVHLEQIAKKIGVSHCLKPVRFEALASTSIHQQKTAAALRYNERLFQGVQKPTDGRDRKRAATPVFGYRGHCNPFSHITKPVLQTLW